MRIENESTRSERLAQPDFHRLLIGDGLAHVLDTFGNHFHDVIWINLAWTAIPLRVAPLISVKMSLIAGSMVILL